MKWVMCSFAEIFLIELRRFSFDLPDHITDVVLFAFNQDVNMIPANIIGIYSVILFADDADNYFGNFDPDFSSSRIPITLLT
jgi:hypothetical protein